MAGATSSAPAPAPASAIVRDGTAASPLLGRMLVEWPDVLREEVLKKWLDPTDCALLARACWKCDEAVASAAGLACAVDSAVVPLAPLKIVDFVGFAELLAWGQAHGCPPWDAARGLCGGRAARAAAGVAVAAVARLPVIQDGVRARRTAWALGGVALGAGARLHLPLVAGTCVLKLAKGCTWGSSTCARTALGGHLEVLRWARDHDCPWNTSTCLFGPLRAGT